MTTYTVTRFCCRSGACLACMAHVSGKGRKRIVHAKDVSEKTARAMLAGWCDFEPQVSPKLPGTK